MTDPIDFGDIEDDDVFDTDTTIAPEQLARRLHRLRRHAGRESIDWHDLDEDERRALVEIATRLVEWLRKEGPR